MKHRHVFHGFAFALAAFFLFCVQFSFAAKYSYECTKSFQTIFTETGTSATIDAAAASDGTTYVEITATGNGLTTDDWVLIDGTTNYDGYFQVTAATDYVRIDVPPAVYTAETFAGTEVMYLCSVSATPLTYTEGKIYTFDAVQHRDEFTLLSLGYEPGTDLKFIYDPRGQNTAFHWPDPGYSEAYVATGASAAVAGSLLGITAGTVTASKAVVVSSSKDIGDFRNLDAVNIDAGASGTAGSVDVFPTTASKGKLSLACTDQTGNTTVTVNANAMGQATTVNIPDPGASASYVVQSTAALTLAEADVLDAVTAGTVAASKAVVVDANKDIGNFRYLDVVSLHAGESGVAGNIDVYPSTASCGKFSLTSSNASGDFDTVVTTVTAVGQASTFTIPDPGAATASFVLTAAAQSIGGVKTFTDAPLVTINDATDNAVVDVYTLTHSTSGTAAAGIGTGISIKSEDASGNLEEIVSLDSVLTTATHSSEDADFIINTMQNGVMAPAFTLDASDQSLTIGQNATDADSLDKLRIYPLTASKGSLMIQATANTGDTVTSITNAAHGQATALTIPDIGQATGNIVLLKASQTTAGELKRADLTEEALVVHAVSVFSLFAPTTMLPLGASSSSGVLGVTLGTHGTNSPVIIGEAASGTSKTDACRFLFVIPNSYVSGGDVKVRLHCRVTVAATVSATVDCECYEGNGEAGVSAELCSTAATSMNSDTWADVDFTITSTDLVPGDVLDIKLTAVVNDTGGTTGAIAQIGKVSLLLDTKG